MVVKTVTALYFHLPCGMITTLATLYVQIKNSVEAKSKITAPCK